MNLGQTALALLALSYSLLAAAADYQIDKVGQHAFINFKISHLGYSWLHGTFKDFDGSFSFDEANPEASRVRVTINTASIDSNHAERDKHLRGENYLNAAEYPQAIFVSTEVRSTGANTVDIIGDLTLNGITRSVTIRAWPVGQGLDPWGGYRAGFEGRSQLKLEDFGIDEYLGPGVDEVALMFSIEGVRQ